MAANVEIHLCAETDLVEVAALFEQWQSEESVWGLRAESAERLRKRMGEFFFVARAEGKTVGFAIGKLDTERFCIFPDGRPYVEIEDVFVAKGSRGRGVGTALMEALIAAGTAKGVAGFHLYSASRKWQHSVKFYERFGLQVWAFQMYKK